MKREEQDETSIDKILFRHFLHDFKSVRKWDNHRLERAFLYVLNFYKRKCPSILVCRTLRHSQVPTIRLKYSRPVPQRQGGQTNCLWQHRASASRRQECG